MLTGEMVEVCKNLNCKMVTKPEYALPTGEATQHSPDWVWPLPPPRVPPSSGTTSREADVPTCTCYTPDVQSSLEASGWQTSGSGSSPTHFTGSAPGTLICDWFMDHHHKQGLKTINSIHIDLSRKYSSISNFGQHRYIFTSLKKT